MPFTTGKWTAKAKALLNGYTANASWRAADAASVRDAVRGISLSSGRQKSEGAAKIVFNISSAHIPSFAASLTKPAYQNRYDVQRRLGSPKPTTVDKREEIDRMLASLIGKPANWRGLYYGAVELNGSGVRYYGDICLVLKRVDPRTLILNRNSFDLICAPLRENTHDNNDAWDSSKAEAEADLIAGEWGSEIGDIAVCKVLKLHSTEDRRLTIGAISEGLLNDEDYLETLCEASFDVNAVKEARLSAADVAADAIVADRLRRGPTPSWAELMWRHRRRMADQALQRHAVRTRVVVSNGRVRP